LKTGGGQLVESPDYGKIRLSDKGRQKADFVLNPEKYESVEKDDDSELLHWASEELVYFFMQNMDDEISECMSSGEDLHVYLSDVEAFNIELVDNCLEENASLFIDAVRNAFREFVDEESGSDVRVVFDNDNYLQDIGAVKHSDNMDSFVQVEGMIRLCEDLKTRIDAATFECVNCGSQVKKDQDTAKLKSPYKCEECGSRKFRPVDKHYSDLVEFEISSNDVQDDSLKCRAFLQHLFDGYSDALQTGRRVRLSGEIVKEKVSKSSDDMRTVFNVLGYDVQDKKTDFNKVDQDVKDRVKEKVEASNNPFKDFALSIAPDIVEMDLAKKQVAASLIGGTPFEDKREWGRIHSCFYSNPGMGKSALLDEVNEVFGNVHSADNNSSGVGLTGSVTQTEDNRWRVTAGTMVFADRGVLTIDEFDKVDGDDLSSLNTAMESGIIKINKAAQARLPARAAVVVGGNFDTQLTEYDDVNNHLPEKAIGLSDRFALMSAITEQDTDRVSDAIMDKYSDCVSDNSVDFSRKELVVYRNMASRFYPKLSDEARSRLKEFIKAEKDVASSKNNEEFKGESNRFIEQLAMLTMMFARSRFSSQTSVSDAENAYQLFRECRRTLGSDVGDPGVKGTQRARYNQIREKYDLLKDDDGEVEVQNLVEESSLNSNAVEDIIDSMKRDGEFYEPEQGVVKEI